MSKSVTQTPSTSGQGRPESEDFIAFDFSDSDKESNKQTTRASQNTSRGEETRRGRRRASPNDEDTRRSRGRKRARSSDEEGELIERRKQTQLPPWRLNRRPMTMQEWIKQEAPWAAHRKHGYYTRIHEMLHQEVKDFVDYISPTPEEHEMRLIVVRRIEKAVKKLWPDVEVCIFGSYDTRLYLPTSDIDVVLLHQEFESYGRTQIGQTLRKIAKLLTREGIASETRVVPKAKVPIVKMTEAVTDYRVDISLNVTNGVKNCKTIKSYLARYPATRPLLLVIKQYLLQRSLNEVFSGGLGSYALIIMMISFLQMHPLVQTGQIRAEDNLGVLLMEALELYGRNFSYENVGIRIRGNGEYYSKHAMNRVQPNNLFSPSLEDPDDSDNDVGKGSFNMNRVRQALGGAFEQLKAAAAEWVRDGRFVEKPTLLSHIIHISPDVLKHREQVAEAYINGELHRELGLKHGFSEDETAFSNHRIKIDTKKNHRKEIEYVYESEDEDQAFQRIARQAMRARGLDDDDIEESYALRFNNQSLEDGEAEMGQLTLNAFVKDVKQSTSQLDMVCKSLSRKKQGRSNDGNDSDMEMSDEDKYDSVYNRQTKSTRRR